MKLPWLVCYDDGGRLLRCFACGTRYEAEAGAAFLNRFGKGRFCVVREEEYRC